MRRIIPAVALSIPILLVGAPHVRGQAVPTPTPTTGVTPTPTPAVDAQAAQLLTQAETALNHANAVRLKGTITQNIPSIGRSVQTAREDFSLKPKHETEQDTTVTQDRVLNRRTVSHSHIVVVGGVEAHRSGKKAWKCSASPVDPVGDAINPFASSGETLQTTETMRAATTVGSTPVWVIREHVTNPKVSAPYNTAHIDYFISKATGRALRLVLWARLNFGSIYLPAIGTVKEVIDFSHFREHVKASLPTACRSYQPAPSSTPVSIFGSALIGN